MYWNELLKKLMLKQVKHLLLFLKLSCVFEKVSHLSLYLQQWLINANAKWLFYLCI